MKRLKSQEKLVGDFTMDICGRIYTVRFAPSDILSNGRLVNGFCDQGKHAIEVSGSICRAEQRSTLLHEVLHACFAWGTDSTEERAVIMLELAVYQVLRSPANEWFVAFMLEPDSVKGDK